MVNKVLVILGRTHALIATGLPYKKTSVEQACFWVALMAYSFVAK